MVLTSRIALVFALVFATGCGEKAQDAADKAKEVAGAAGEKAKVAGEKAVDGAKKAMAGAQGGLTAIAAEALLAPVPADTPYVMANLAPLPADFQAKLGTALDPLLKKFEAELVKEKASLGDSPEDKLGKAIVEELEGNLSRAGMEKLGLDPDMRFVIYGMGLMPVLRMQLKDAATFQATVARVEAKAGLKAPTAKLGDQTYWLVQEDGMTIAIAVVGNFLVAGVVPDALAPKALPLMFGQAAPSASASAAFKASAQKHGFQGFAGYIDATIIASTVMGDAQGLSGEIFTALSKGEAPVLPPVCKTEISGMVANFPRVAFGYTEVSGQRIAARYILEAKPALAQELKGLTNAVPGLGKDEGALLAFGAGLNLQKALDFAKAKAGAVKAAPYQCPLLADFNTGMGQMADGLAAAPIPPFVMGVRGFNVVIKDGKMGQNGPTGVRGTAIFAADKAPELLEMAKGMVPPLAGVQVTADGKATPLPPGLIPPVVEAPHIAMSANAIAISVGPGEEQALPGLVSAKADGSSPVLAFTYDVKRFVAMFAEQMNQGMGAEEKVIFDATIGMLGVTRYALDLQDAGVV
ncbi:MAG: hypothetical protein KC549_13220, partial [Myxococcales bacterium]|nr:hypothetical protein [Myxococcales bacterium]